MLRGWRALLASGQTMRPSWLRGVTQLLCPPAAQQPRGLRNTLLRFGVVSAVRCWMAPLLENPKYPSRGALVQRLLAPFLCAGGDPSSEFCPCSGGFHAEAWLRPAPAGGCGWGQEPPGLSGPQRVVSASGVSFSKLHRGSFGLPEFIVTVKPSPRR